MLGGLARWPIARPQPPAQSLFFRHFSTPRTPASLVLRLSFPRSCVQNHAITLPAKRNLSLDSIFGPSKPSPVPTPLVVAHITRLEAEADVNPHDVAKQVALFEALVETKMKPSYELVINRWERMCEHVRLRHVSVTARPSNLRNRTPLRLSLRPPRLSGCISLVLLTLIKSRASTLPFVGETVCSQPTTQMCRSRLRHHQRQLKATQPLQRSHPLQMKL